MASSRFRSAAAKGDAHSVDRLLISSPNVIFDVDGSGRTALHYAAGNGEVECVRRLLTARADINASDTCGATALDQAVY